MERMRTKQANPMSPAETKDATTLAACLSTEAMVSYPHFCSASQEFTYPRSVNYS
jgi:hypothetical protein